ncbi:MAG: beta-lactamase family protein [Pirellulaceae bacterium]|nr:beta-lactamase family protein [Pirellulaceae bacterium]
MTRNAIHHIQLCLAIAVGATLWPLGGLCPSLCGADHAQVQEALTKLIAREMSDKGISALSIAVVDDQQIVWSQGFGLADSDAKRPATAETVYRVGSVSKLLTDMAVMRLVERGEIDLDAPVAKYLPEFQPRSPFPKPITLRMLMSHRAGLVREPPTGNYFAPDHPSLADTVRSLNETELVYEPEAKSKYSNAGIAVVGYVLERTQKQPFADYLEQALLTPLGLRNSAFQPRPEIVRDLAQGTMWTYEGLTFPAPKFELGIAPAGSMYATVNDLGRFISVLLSGGRGPSGQVLQPETIETMWTPQFAPPGQRTGFGIGFHVTEFEGQRRVGHDGAIYGFATTLQVLPESKLGVAAVANRDFANPVVDRIAETALRWMLAARRGETLTPPETTQPVPPELVPRLAGRYGHGDQVLDLIAQDGQLYLAGNHSEYRRRLRWLDDALIVDDVLGYGQRLVPRDDRLLVNGAAYQRRERWTAGPVPQRWRGLVGDYGWDHNTLKIRTNADGQLEALIEWFAAYPLLEVSEHVFSFPSWGLYDGELLVFQRDDDGRATRVQAASVVFERRP